MTRVAVQAGAAWLRVAAEGRVVAELPAGREDLSTVLAGLFDGPVDELAVVGAQAEPVGARTVTCVPTAVAALAGCAAGGPAPTCAVVVDVGHRRTEITRVRAGNVVGTRWVAVGGADLDAETVQVLARLGAVASPAEARRVRETLSLLPEAPAGAPPVVVAAQELRTALSAPLGAVVAAVRDVVAAAAPDHAPPVLLIGGVARSPLLAELLDDADVDDVRVADRPDRAAVLGALRLPADPSGDALPAPAPERTWLPPPRPPRHRVARAVLGAVAAVAAVAGLLVAGAALPDAAPPATGAGDLVQYDYAVRLPAGWAHVGGLPERRRSLLAPAAAAGGSDRISVESTPLDYDADAEPLRARAELRAVFAAAVARGEPLSAFDDDARYAGRAVVTYRQSGAATSGNVDWYVVLAGDAQLSVGCQHTPAGAAAVRAACATVVGSLRRTG